MNNTFTTTGLCFPFQIIYTCETDDEGRPGSIEHKLSVFAKYEPGWHYGEGDRIPSAVIRTAKLLVRQALALQAPHVDVFPRVDGAVTVALYFGNQDYALHVLPDLTLEFDSETSSDLGPFEKLTLHNALFLLQSLSQWYLSGSSTFMPTIGTPKNFAVPSSRIPATELEFPFSIRTVPKKNQPQSVITSNSTTLQSRDSHQSLSNLKARSCLAM